MSRHQIAATISGDKRQHPERYCPARRCLWKTSEIGPDGGYILNANPCRKHPEQNTAPSRKYCQHDWADTPNGWQCKLCGTFSHESARALAEDTFARIDRSNAAQDAHARR